MLHSYFDLHVASNGRIERRQTTRRLLRDRFPDWTSNVQANVGSRWSSIDKVNTRGRQEIETRRRSWPVDRNSRKRTDTRDTSGKNSMGSRGESWKQRRLRSIDNFERLSIVSFPRFISILICEKNDIRDTDLLDSVVRCRVANSPRECSFSISF